MRRQADEMEPLPGGARHAAPPLEALRSSHPPRRIAIFVSIMCGTLVLTGCAAGAPSVVAPVAPDSSEVLVPEHAEPTPPVAGAPAPATTETVPAVEKPVDAAPSQEPVAAASAEELLDSTTVHIEPATAPDTAAFVRDAPAVTAPLAAPAAQTTTSRPPPPPEPGSGMSTLVEGGTNGRLEVALTFDAGADTGYGPAILDLLRDEGIAATFGVTGVYAQANRDLVRRMATEGHQIINHTWDHPSLTGANTGQPRLSAEQLAQQLADTEALIGEITDGYQMRPYFRPPYGDYDAEALAALYANGYALSIMWTCDSQAWRGWSAQEIIDYCTTNIRPHEILLMHLGSDARGDYEALPGIIRFFRDNGYAFVTIEQMLQP